MRRSRLHTLVPAALVLTVLTAPTGADAKGQSAAAPASAALAAAPVVVGETITSISPVVGCAPMTVAQTSTADGSTSYSMPHSGVITSWSHYAVTGTTGHQVRALAFRAIPSTQTHDIVARSAPHTVELETNTFQSRMPVRAGDVLGMTFTWTTACGYSTSAPGNVAEFEPAAEYDPDSGNPFVGELFQAPVRLNISAVLEPDMDEDGYGDLTQDECPTSASTQGPCEVFEVGQTGVGDVPNSYCGPDLVGVQGTGSELERSYVVPEDGVLTQWSHDATAAATNPGATMRLLVVRPQEDPGNYLTVARTSPQPVTGGQLNTVSGRIAVSAGDQIALTWFGGGNLTCSYVGLAGNQYRFKYGAADQDTPFNTSSYGTNRRLNLAAIVEPDIDEDGYGDVSQDECPTSASTQGPCTVFEVGQTGSSSDGDAYCSPTVVGIQGASSELQRSYVVPEDGVLTQWSHDATTADATGAEVRLLVVRPDPTPYVYAIVARTGPQPVVSGQLNTFSGRLPVSAGDRIALTWSGSGGLNCSYPGLAGNDYRFNAAVADSDEPFPTFDHGTNRRLNLAAIVEPDADGDGYGDVTQDACPSQKQPNGGACDLTAPQTTYKKKPASPTTLRKATFRFVSNEPGSTFQCKLDRGAWKACTSPTTRKVKPGKHVFRVRATDKWGNTDATPAVARWKVLRS